MKNDIESLTNEQCLFSHYLETIEEVGADKTWIEFTKRIIFFYDYVDDVRFKNKGLYFFKTNSLTVENLFEEEKKKSLTFMRKYLDKHIENEVEMELIKIKSELIKKYREKYHYDTLISKLDS